MASASRFTKVTLVQQLTIDEANALLRLMEVGMLALTTDEQILVTGIHQTMKKAVGNGRI